MKMSLESPPSLEEQVLMSLTTGTQQDQRQMIIGSRILRPEVMITGALYVDTPPSMFSILIEAIWTGLIVAYSFSLLAALAILSSAMLWALVSPVISYFLTIMIGGT